MSKDAFPFNTHLATLVGLAVAVISLTAFSTPAFAGASDGAGISSLGQPWGSVAASEWFTATNLVGNFANGEFEFDGPASGSPICTLQAGIVNSNGVAIVTPATWTAAADNGGTCLTNAYTEDVTPPAPTTSDLTSNGTYYYAILTQSAAEQADTPEQYTAWDINDEELAQGTLEQLGWVANSGITPVGASFEIDNSAPTFTSTLAVNSATDVKEVDGVYLYGETAPTWTTVLTWTDTAGGVDPSGLVAIDCGTGTTLTVASFPLTTTASGAGCTGTTGAQVNSAQTGTVGSQDLLVPATSITSSTAWASSPSVAFPSGITVRTNTINAAGITSFTCNGDGLSNDVLAATPTGPGNDEGEATIPTDALNQTTGGTISCFATTGVQVAGASSSTTVNIDPTVPATTLSSSVASSAWYSGQTAVPAIVADTTSGPSGVTITCSGDGIGTQSFTSTGQTLDLNGIDQGSGSISCQTVTGAGVTGNTASLAVNVDSAAPAVSVTPPLTQQAGAATGISATVQAGASGVASVTATATENGSTYTLAPSGLTGPVTFADSNVPAGAYTVTITATSGAGVKTTQTVLLTLSPASSGGGGGGSTGGGGGSTGGGTTPVTLTASYSLVCSNNKTTGCKASTKRYLVTGTLSNKKSGQAVIVTAAVKVKVRVKVKVKVKVNGKTVTRTEYKSEYKTETKTLGRTTTGRNGTWSFKLATGAKGAVKFTVTGASKTVTIP